MNSRTPSAIYKDRARRAGTKDLLNRSLEDLQHKINDKWKTYYLILKESGRHDEATAATLRQLNSDRLGRIDAELMRLEGEQLKQEGEEKIDSKFYEARISQLRERQAELEKRIVQLTEPSVELDYLKAEIRLLQEIADEIGMQVLKLSIDDKASSRIELVQRAEVSPAK